MILILWWNRFHLLIVVLNLHRWLRFITVSCTCIFTTLFIVAPQRWWCSKNIFHYITLHCGTTKTKMFVKHHVWFSTERNKIRKQCFWNLFNKTTWHTLKCYMIVSKHDECDFTIHDSVCNFVWLRWWIVLHMVFDSL